MTRTQVLGGLILLIAAWLQFHGGGSGGSAPFPTDKLSVLIVESTDDRDTLRSQLNAMESTIWREYVKGKGGDARLLEPEAKLKNEAEWVAPALAVKRDSLPWLVISDGKRGYSGPLPADIDGLMAKLKEIGG